MKCVTIVSFLCPDQWKTGHYFKPTKGLRQGDPLSPYLFLLISEGLSVNLSKAVSDKRLHGIKLSRDCPGIYHLFFADDSLYFLKASIQNCQVLINIIMDFCAAFGQSINSEKSSMFFTPNTPTDLQAQIGHMFNISATNHAGKYLGLPTHWCRSKSDALACVRDRIKAKLNGWKSEALSQAGKEVLIKAVATAVPSYPMSCFKMPVALCRAINSNIANFWWGQMEDSNKIHWQAWSKLCKSKGEGGLGFRDLESFNLALLAKQCWIILKNPSALWVRILKARYFNNCNFFQAKIGSRSSWAWSSILAGRETISCGARWQVNNGKYIQVWEDRWIPNIPDGKLHPLPTSNRFTPLTVHEIIDEDMHTWRTDHIEPFILESEAIAINDIVIGYTNIDDTLIWPMEKSALYIVKSGYHFVHTPSAPVPKASSSHMISKKVWSIIWGMDTLNKIKHFLWRVLSNSLLTTLNLYKRKSLNSPICSFCGAYEESVEHCLLLCDWTKAT
ncbi:hypothetical protein M0R45_002308 [Rubus argutus]